MGDGPRGTSSHSGSAEGDVTWLKLPGQDWSAEKEAGDQSAGRCRNPTDGGLGLEVAAKGMLSGRIQDIFGRQAQRIR